MEAPSPFVVDHRRGPTRGRPNSTSDDSVLGTIGDSIHLAKQIVKKCLRPVRVYVFVILRGQWFTQVLLAEDMRTSIGNFRYFDSFETS